jgi:hypothetical protein
MADTKTSNRKPRRRRTPPNIEVHWRWPDLPGLSQDQADRLGAVAIKLLARKLMPLLVEIAIRDSLREEQARVRPPSCMLCGLRIPELLAEVALEGRHDQSARLCPTCRALCECGIVKPAELAAARDAWCDGAWPEATRLHRRLEAELTKGARKVKQLPVPPDAAAAADNPPAARRPTRRKSRRSDDT